jgi:hypothetical protein
MAYEALLAGAVLGGVSSTIGAFASKSTNDAIAEQQSRQLRAKQYEIFEQQRRNQATGAAIGNYAATTRNVNQSRQAIINMGGEFSIAKSRLRAETQVGFINAAMGTSIQVGQAFAVRSNEMYQQKQLSSQRSQIDALTQALGTT